MELVIGDRAYSTWSLRPWLVLKRCGADFTTTEVRLNRDDTAEQIARHSPSGKVPVLKVEGETIWDSLSISVWCAERYPNAGLWPADAHARWMAAKGIAGWKAGPARDDRKMIHPDMIPYVELDEPAKQKDRDVVDAIPDMAALSGEQIKRERRIGVPRPLEDDRYEALLAGLRQTPKASRAVAVLPLDDPGLVRLASRLVNVGIFVEAVLDQWVDELRADDEIAVLLADVLHRAWRIHVVQEGNGRDALNELVDELVDGLGTINACP